MVTTKVSLYRVFRQQTRFLAAQQGKTSGSLWIKRGEACVHLLEKKKRNRAVPRLLLPLRACTIDHDGASLRELRRRLLPVEGLHRLVLGRCFHRSEEEPLT